MMRYFIVNAFTGLAFFLLCSPALRSQIPMDVETGKFIYEEVVQAAGISREDLFQKASNWLAGNLNATGDSIIDISPDHKYIKACKTLMFPSHIIGSIDTTIKNRLTFKLCIYFKDNRFKYTADGFIYHYYLVAKTAYSMLTDPLEEVKYLKKKKEKVYARIDESISALIASLKNSLSGNQDQEEEEEDW